MRWVEVILRERNKIEVATGWSPGYVIIKEDVWEEMFEQEGVDFSGTELGEMTVAISSTLVDPYVLVLDASRLNDA